jgi:hypothetical protein
VTSQHVHDAAIGRSRLELSGQVIDLFQPCLVDFDTNFAFRRECDRFREVPAGKLIEVILDNDATTRIPKSGPGSAAIPANPANESSSSLNTEILC